MLRKLLFSSMITLVILEISGASKTQAEHKNSLINRFCMATLRSKVNIKNRENSSFATSN